jgi:hypothetical protein
LKALCNLWLTLHRLHSMINPKFHSQSHFLINSNKFAKFRIFYSQQLRLLRLSFLHEIFDIDVLTFCNQVFIIVVRKLIFDKIINYSEYSIYHWNLNLKIDLNANITISHRYNLKPELMSSYEMIWHDIVWWLWHSKQEQRDTWLLQSKITFLLPCN